MSNKLVVKLFMFMWICPVLLVASGEGNQAASQEASQEASQARAVRCVV